MCGEKGEVAFITCCPVFSSADIALARIAFQEEGDQHTLVYGEESLSGTYLADATHKIQNEQSNTMKSE